ncbi:MAG: AraC family transcriptional regulator, partial [Bacteroidota bacterium]
RADNITLHYTLEKLGQSANRISRESISLDQQIELYEMQPGSYKLTVRAIQQNGRQLGQSLEIPIQIQKPFYQRPFFWIGVGIGLLLVIWRFISWRTTRLEQQNAALEQKVSERTQQVLHKQQTINEQAELIESMRTQLDQRDQQWLAQFRDIIHKRLGDPNLYLPDIIDEMETGRTVFYEKVKDLTGMTPNHYIQQMRLTQARSLLEAGAVKTVKELASAVGMKEPKYFSRLFKEHFGVAPSTFLRKPR